MSIGLDQLGREWPKADIVRTIAKSLIAFSLHWPSLPLISAPMRVVV